MQFTFAQVERALALTNNIADERRSAFSHRLKHLQRLKFPPGVNTGRGRAATYTVGHLYLLGVALELNQLGSTPERAVRTIQQNRLDIEVAAAQVCLDGPPEGAFEFPVVLYYDPAALRDLMAMPADGETAASLHYGDILTSADHLKSWMRGGLSRLAFISVSALAWDLANYCGGKHEDFYAELNRWARACVKEHPSRDDPNLPF